MSKSKTFPYQFLKDAYKDFSQDQRSLTEQLEDLWYIANILKLYDAADYLSHHVRKTKGDNNG